MYSKPRYNRKSHRSAGRGRTPRNHHRAHRGRRYSGYHYPQPSNSKVYIEEPETEEEESGSEYDVSPEDEVYEFGLDDNSDNERYYDEEPVFYEESDSESDDDKEEIFIIADDAEDINDVLANEALDYLEAEGSLRDVNDDLVRYYDSDSESSDSDLSSDVSEASDDESELDVELDSEIEDLQKTLYLLAGEDDEDSVTDLEIDSDLSSSDELENIRHTFADELDSSDEESVSDLSSDSDDDIFFEVGSDYDSSDDDLSDDDISVDENLSDSSDSDSSDDEGITIYRHRFDLPDRYDSDNDSTDEELALYEPDQKYLLANDSDDEFDVIDLTKDLKDSKDCEVLELDDNTYKLNLRLPSLIKEDLKIDFSKAKNELVITGKFSFTGEESEESEESDVEEVSEVDRIAEALESEDPQAAEAKAEAEQAAEDEEDDEEYESADSSSSSSSSSSSESDSSDSDSDSSSSSSSDSESESDSDEEVVEDAQDLIEDFKNQEIQFEKHFVFDKIIRADQISAKFLPNGELEMILPNEGVEVDTASDKIAIAIESAEEAAEPAEDVVMEE